MKLKVFHFVLEIGIFLLLVNIREDITQKKLTCQLNY